MAVLLKIKKKKGTKDFYESQKNLSLGAKEPPPSSLLDWLFEKQQAEKTCTE